MPQENGRKILEFIRAESRDWACCGPFECAEHPGELATGSCPACGKPLCHECLMARRGKEGLCQACFAARRGATLATNATRLAKQPAIWVALCIAVSAALYAAGVGNPGVDELAKADSGRDWHKRESARVFLSQGARERRRVAAMKSEGADEAEIRRWSLMAAKSYAEAARLWGDTPASFAPALAAADSLSTAGETEKALEDALKIEAPAIKDERPPFHLALGRIALAAGDQALAKECFKKAYDEAKDSKTAIVDTLIDHMSGNRVEASFASKVLLVCGLGASPSEVEEECAKLLGLNAEEGLDVQRAESPSAEGKDEGIKVEFIDSSKGGG